MTRLIEKGLQGQSEQSFESEVELSELILTSDLKSEYDKLVEQSLALEDAQRVIGKLKTHLHASQESGVSLDEDHYRLYRLALESALGSDEHLPETIDTESLDELEKRIEYAQENLFERIGDFFDKFGNRFNPIRAGLKELQKKLEDKLRQTDDLNTDKSFKIAKTAGSNLIGDDNEIEVTKLPNQLKQNNDQVRKFMNRFFSFANSVYEQIESNRSKINKAAEKSDDEQKAAKEAQGPANDLIKILEDHLDDVRSTHGQKFLGRFEVVVPEKGKWKAKLKDGDNWQHLVTPQIKQVNKVKNFNRELPVPDKRAVEDILSETSSAIDIMEEGFDFIEKTIDSMKKASKEAEDKPKVRRRIFSLDNLVTLVNNGLVGVLALYFGDGLQRFMRSNNETIFATIDYQAKIIGSSLQLVERALKAGK